MSYIEISDDEDNSVLTGVKPDINPITISSDEDTQVPTFHSNFTSDEDEPIDVNISEKKRALIKNLFPSAQPISKANQKIDKPIVSETKQPTGIEKMICSIKVHIPVEPYGSQIALMFKVITAINRSQNCLLESPTGSGKTLALLCGALAWVRHEKNRISQQLAQELLNQHHELDPNEVSAYITTPAHDKTVTADNYFDRPIFGHISIYDDPALDAGDASSSSKRQEPLNNSTENSSDEGLVKIHKKRRLNSSGLGDGDCGTSTSSTPEKIPDPPQHETPQKVRLLYDLVDNLRLRTSMHVGSSIPTIYYGTRTHKQLQQVVKEFARTDYCGEMLMTILSSREYSCIREFDRKTWSSKNDMCRACIKPTSMDRKEDTNCKFYDNRTAINHDCMPPAFDLEELVSKGEELRACPYFAARRMAAKAHIVFCPYNYLIEPSIRSSMQIELEGNVVIMDEAHNIEDICRDSATFTLTKDQVQDSIKELEVVAGYRFANQDAISYVEYLLQALKHWDDWFVNQTPLINQQPMNGGEAVYTWEVEHFVQTLDNHNIGQQHFNEFRKNAEIFCRRLREDPRTLLGVSQHTGTLIESIDTVLGYLFRYSGKYMDDFKPALIRNLSGNKAGYMRFDKAADKETLSLRLMCMNPAVVFEGLKKARCIILASGTLAPIDSLHSELATTFPLKVSPNHIIPPDRVWIGTLSTCPNGKKLECNHGGTDKTGTQDALGQIVLWVSKVTPNGVLCFVPSYQVMNKLVKRWKETNIWQELNKLKHVFMESRNTRDHNNIMEDFYENVSTERGALLFAVYRGKVSEGMDFKDHQARVVIAIGIPYPNTFDMSVREKMNYNNKYATERKLLESREWLLVQAFRALNQAVGRCVRHCADWGGVLLVDARFENPHYTHYLSYWVKIILGKNHHTFNSLIHSANSLESFIQNMTIRDSEEI